MYFHTFVILNSSHYFLHKFCKDVLNNCLSYNSLLSFKTKKDHSHFKDNKTSLSTTCRKTKKFFFLSCFSKKRSIILLFKVFKHLNINNEQGISFLLFVK